MAGDLIRFVSAIDAAPTTRLDLNDELSFWVKSFSAPPPRLRRSMAANAMRDGINVGSSTYDSRTLVIELECRKSTQDAAATEIQKLWRELDRATNVIQYQPNSLTKLVFFRTFRSDASQLEDVMGQAAMRTFTIEVLAEPFALGLKESLGPYTVSNNPAAGSNGCFFDAGTVLGDVPAPVVLWTDSTSFVDHLIAVTHTTTAVPLTWVQAESVSLGTDTTNPGGGPDAVMSGAGTNNFVRTSFATPAMTARLTWTVPATTLGRYRILVFGRPSSASGEFGFAVGAAGAAFPESTTVSVIPIATGRMVVDLGLRDFTQGAPMSVGYGTIAPAKGTQQVSFFASRVSGTSTFDWDAIVLVPAGGQAGEMAPPSTLMTTATAARTVVDGVTEQVVGMSSAGDPTAGAGTFRAGGLAAGSFPYFSPGAANRVFLIRRESPTGLSAVAVTESVSLAYWPRYLHVRPVSS